MKDKIRKLIEDGDLATALEETKRIVVNDRQSLHELTVAALQLSEINKQFNLGTIEIEKFLKIKTQIAFTILGKLQKEENTYKNAFQKWVQKRFANAKEIKFDLKITPKLFVDCYVEREDDWSIIFTLSKDHVENLKETITNIYKIIWAHEFYYVSIDDHEDAISYLDFFIQDDEYDGIMDINEIEGVDILPAKINENGEFIPEGDFWDEEIELE